MRKTRSASLSCERSSESSEQLGYQLITEVVLKHSPFRKIKVEPQKALGVSLDGGFSSWLYRRAVDHPVNRQGLLMFPEHIQSILWFEQSLISA